MILGHLKQVRDVHSLSEDVALRQLRFRHDVAAFGQGLHSRFGTLPILLGGFSAGFVFDRLRPHWRGIHSGGNLGLGLLRALPLIELVTRTVGHGDVGVD